MTTVVPCPWCGAPTTLIAYRSMTDTIVRRCPAEDRLCAKTGDGDWYDPEDE